MERFYSEAVRKAACHRPVTAGNEDFDAHYRAKSASNKLSFPIRSISLGTMSTCERCGATFHCAMADNQASSEAGGDEAPCWCTHLPPVVPVPRQEGAKEGQTATAAVGCWCPDCLKAHIAALRR
ncbi:cysteine-rich CWC family protein [Pseudoduganella albidiflava]|uniref:cysteine-rich CWC family protein n=1 Tax=Pseudoduganella albidiflava TaxID=321983 RepID=UPI001E2CBA8E|nr:cysteine-rich CWC family protein [Pseudoduganella albidiflava]